MTEYPNILPSPRLTHSDSTLMETVDSKFSEGQITQRNRFDVLNEAIPLSCTFNSSEMNIFRGWFHHKLFNGTASFNMELLLNDSLETFYCKLRESRFEAKRLSHDHWEVNFVVYIEDTQVMDEGDVDLIITNNPPDTAPNLLADTERYTVDSDMITVDAEP